VLGKYVRDDKVLSLPDAIHRMTGLAASQIGIRDRGLNDRHRGSAVFNAATITDTATAPASVSDRHPVHASVRF
jgi:N-acyl-D-amino-acid deacylase